MRDIEMKRGVNRPIFIDLENEDGTAYDLSEVTEIKATVRDSTRAVVAHLDIKKDPSNAGRIVINTGPTDDWKIGIHLWDAFFYYGDGQSFSMPEAGFSKWEVTENIT
jgi:hypothetical protein